MMRTMSTTTTTTMIPCNVSKIPVALLLIASLLAAVTTTVNAEKDGNYYPSGMKNPNVNEKMYWRNAYDVIDDISSFDALYVKFHSCAWSPYADGCGAEGDDTTWYWGFTSCYRANVGYSLYGALKGRTDKQCTKTAYINSFFTNTGVEAFTDSMMQAGMTFSDTGDDNNDGNDDGNSYAGGVSSVCSTDQTDDDSNRNKNHNEKSHTDAKSYGIGCNKNRFAKRTFNGAYCDGNSVSRTTDNLRTFNKEISSADCVQIYSSADGDYDDESAAGLLENSEACNIRAYPDQCPDPHGKLERYTTALERSTGTGSGFGSGFGRAIKGFFTWIFFLGGLVLYMLGMYAIRWREQRRRKASDRRRKARMSTGGGVPRIGKMFKSRSKQQRSERSEMRDSERESEYESP